MNSGDEDVVGSDDIKNLVSVKQKEGRGTSRFLALPLWSLW